MKRFVFSLQSVLNLKGTMKKQKQFEYSQACAQHDNLLAEQNRLREEMEACDLEYTKALSGKITAHQMAWHDNYSDYLNNTLEQLRPAIKAAHDKKEALREQLVSLMREMDTLEKLKQEQYSEYLANAQKEEEKILGDIMSYESSVNMSSPESEPS